MFTPATHVHTCTLSHSPCAHVCSYVSVTCVCMHVCARVHMCLYVHMHEQAYTQRRLTVHTCTHMHRCAHMQATHAQTHAHSCAHTHARSQRPHAHVLSCTPRCTGSLTQECIHTGQYSHRCTRTHLAPLPKGPSSSGSRNHPARLASRHGSSSVTSTRHQPRCPGAEKSLPIMVPCSPRSGPRGAYTEGPTLHHSP